MSPRFCSISLTSFGICTLQRIFSPLAGFKTWAIKHLNELSEKEIDNRNATLKSLQVAYNDCLKRIDNLVQLKISPQNTYGELLSDEEFKKQKETLIKEKSELSEKLGNTDNRVDRWIELSEKTFNFACYARYWFDKGDKQTKKEIFTGLGQNLILKDGIVLPDLLKPLQFIEETRKQTDIISPKLEPNKKGFTEAQLGILFAQNPSVLAKWDEYRHADWPEIVDCPELVLEQTRQLPAI